MSLPLLLAAAVAYVLYTRSTQGGADKLAFTGGTSTVSVSGLSVPSADSYRTTKSAVQNETWSALDSGATPVLPTGQRWRPGFRRASLMTK